MNAISRAAAVIATCNQLSAGFTGTRFRHVVAVDEAPHRHREVGQAEDQQPGDGRPCGGRHEHQERSGGDVYDVVPAVDLEDDEVLAVQVAPGGETAAAEEEAEHADGDEDPTPHEARDLRKGAPGTLLDPRLAGLIGS